MSRFKGIYWRTFTVTVGMVALTLVLLGASFFALTYSYIMSEKRGELEDKVEAIAQLAVTAYDDPSLLHSWDQTRREMKDILTVAEKMSGTDFIIILPGLNQFITGRRSCRPQSAGPRRPYPGWAWSAAWRWWRRPQRR